jgi:hypothetical protein
MEIPDFFGTFWEIARYWKVKRPESQGFKALISMDKWYCSEESAEKGQGSAFTPLL